MSNYHQVAIAVRNREVWEKIGKEVAEIADSVAGLKALYDDAELSDIHDFLGHDFLRLDWPDYNHWREGGGDALLQIIEEITKDDGYAYIDIDEYGEETDSNGEDFNFICGIIEASMLIRNSEYKGNATFDSAYKLAKSGANNNKYREEFCTLLTKLGADF